MSGAERSAGAAVVAGAHGSDDVDGRWTVGTDAALVAGGPARLHRRTVAVLLGVLALAVIAMHQLSLGHLVLTSSDAAAHHAGTSSLGAPAVSRPPSEVSATTSITAMTSMSSMTSEHDGSASWSGPGAGTDDGCAGCGGHVLGPGACLLALTLLVLCWWLRLPRVRTRPPERRRLPRPARPHDPPPRSPALTLEELSILRT